MDDEGIIPVLARTVRQVEADAQHGPVRPSRRTAYQVVALLVRVLDGQPAAAIARADFGFLQEIGLREHLSPNRANGLNAMVGLIRAYAAEAAGDDPAAAQKPAPPP